MLNSVFTQSFQRETVDHWLRGTIRLPVSAFLRVVDFKQNLIPALPLTNRLERK